MTVGFPYPASIPILPTKWKSFWIRLPKLVLCRSMAAVPLVTLVTYARAVLLFQLAVNLRVPSISWNCLIPLQKLSHRVLRGVVPLPRIFQSSIPTWQNFFRFVPTVMPFRTCRLVLPLPTSGWSPWLPVIRISARHGRMSLRNALRLVIPTSFLQIPSIRELLQSTKRRSARLIQVISALKSVFHPMRMSHSSASFPLWISYTGKRLRRPMQSRQWSTSLIPWTKSLWTRLPIWSSWKPRISLQRINVRWVLVFLGGTHCYNLKLLDSSPWKPSCSTLVSGASSVNVPTKQLWNLEPSLVSRNSWRVPDAVMSLHSRLLPPLHPVSFWVRYLRLLSHWILITLWRNWPKAPSPIRIHISRTYSRSMIETTRIHGSQSLPMVVRYSISSSWLRKKRKCLRPSVRFLKRKSSSKPPPVRNTSTRVSPWTLWSIQRPLRKK